MKLRRVKFVWSSARIAGGRWHFGLFGLYDRGEGSHDEGLAISLRGLLGWTGVAAVAAYLALATALFWFWQRNPYSLLSYSDALLRPVRREAVRDLQGQAFIAQGTDALRAKRYGEAVALLRQGLAYHPGDLRARLTLAQFYAAVNQRLMALKLLQEGLGNEFPGRIFLQGFLDVAEQGEDYDLVVRTCDRYLPRLPSDGQAAERRWLLARKFTALTSSGNFAAALALADAEEPGDVASEHRVLALLGSNRRDDALAALAEWGRRPGADARAVLRLRARTLREAGRFDEMEPMLEQLRALSPADPQPYVFGVVQRAMGGRDQAALAAFDDYIFRFGGTTQNLQLITAPLAEIGQVGLVERCAAAAADRGYALEPYQILLVQTYVQIGNWAAASRSLTAMKPGVGRAAQLTQAWREWMQRLIAAASGAGDTAGPALVEFLHSRPWPMKIFRKSIETLWLAGRLETARDVVALASGEFSTSSWLESQRGEIGQALAAQDAAKATPAVAAAGLPTEKVFFQRLDDFLRGGQWAGAEQLLHDARTAKAPPAWLVARDGDLRFAQVRLCQGRGEYSEMLAAAKLYLNGEAERARRVTEIARAVFQQGERDSAVRLVQEVMRATSGYPPAQRLLNEWQPNPAKKK